jgi:hypothetical protein
VVAFGKSRAGHFEARVTAVNRSSPPAPRMPLPADGPPLTLASYGAGLHLASRTFVSQS